MREVEKIMHLTETLWTGVGGGGPLALEIGYDEWTFCARQRGCGKAGRGTSS